MATQGNVSVEAGGQSLPPGMSDRYLDFEVEIAPGVGRRYPMSITSSPAGEARGEFAFPYDELALESRLKSLEVALLKSGGKRRQALTGDEQAVQDFGRDLFDALLTGEVRSRYDVSRREARLQGKGLRIKLRIQPPELAQLPWEYLFDPRDAEYLCLSRETPVVRFVELSQPVRPLVVTPPLRVLCMIAAPEDLPLLDGERERMRVDAAVEELTAAGMIEVTWLEGQTWRDLQRAMRGGPWHVFHFIGHGAFDRTADEGFIALADEAGKSRPLLATELGRLLADQPSLRLAILNSCEGARGSEQDVFSSSAAILVRRGLPAVLAMQHEITDRAATEFARSFYEALADGFPVDGAVAEARKSVSLAVSNTIEWGTPVLYMRAPQGVIFEVMPIRRHEGSDDDARVAVERDPETTARLNDLYTEGLSGFWVQDWDKAHASFQAIVDIDPAYEDAATRLTEVDRRRVLEGLAADADAAVEARDWAAAVAALELLVADAPEDELWAARLAEASRELQLSDMYEEAQRLSAAQQWKAVANVGGQIRELDPTFSDPEGVLEAAELELNALERAARLNEQFAAAVRALDADDLDVAREQLEAISRDEPGFRETAALLEQANTRLAAQAEARVRADQVAELYEQAVALSDAHKWRDALGKLDEITELDAAFDDVRGIGEAARLAMEDEEAEAARAEQCDTLYTEAVRLLRDGRYAAAIDKWHQVEALDPSYPDRKKVQAAARRKLTEQAKAAKSPPPHRRRWRWLLGVAGVVLVGIAAMIIWQVSTEPAVPTIHVQFDQDGEPEPEMWDRIGQSGEAIVRGGWLVVDPHQAIEPVGLRLSDVALDQEHAYFVEAVLRLDGEHHGGNALFGLSGIVSESVCSLEQERVVCWHAHGGRRVDQPDQEVPWQLSDEVRFRIEYRPEPPRFEFFIGNLNAGSQFLADAVGAEEEYKVSLRAHTLESDMGVVAYFTDVQVGPLDE